MRALTGNINDHSPFVVMIINSGTATVHQYRKIPIRRPALAKTLLKHFSDRRWRRPSGINTSVTFELVNGWQIIVNDQICTHLIVYYEFKCKLSAWFRRLIHVCLCGSQFFFLHARTRTVVWVAMLCQTKTIWAFQPTSGRDCERGLRYLWPSRPQHSDRTLLDKRRLTASRWIPVYLHTYIQCDCRNC